MTDITITQVREATGVTDTTVIPDLVITDCISQANEEIEGLIRSCIYPSLSSGTVTTLSATTLSDSTQTWVVDAWIGYAVYIYSGTGKGQIREITDNTSTQLTVATWATNPDTTSKYYITYLNKITETYNGNDKDYLFLNNYPIIQVDLLTVDGISVTPSTLYVYNKTGKIELKNTSEVGNFTTVSPQNVSITYHYGVLSEVRRGQLQLPNNLTRAIILLAGMKSIAYQLGGTYNAPASWQLPDMTINIGQASINITATYNTLKSEFELYRSDIIGRWTHFG